MAKQKQTKAEKQADKRIEQAFYKNCSGIQINIFDISKVFAEGRKLVAEGKTDEELGAGLLTFTKSIAVGGVS